MMPPVQITVEGRATRVVQITDTHLEQSAGGRLAGMDTDASLALVLAMIRDAPERPDLLLLTGDLATESSAAAYRRVRDAVAVLDIPWVWIPGNHDDPAVMSAVLSDGASMQRVVELPGWQIVLLDSTERRQVGGTLGTAELAALSEALEAGAQRHSLICMHHQPVAVGSDWIDEQQVSDAAALFEIIDRHANVRALLWGHVHQVFERRHNGIDLLSAPSTCIQFKPGSEDFALDTLAPGLRWLWLHPDGQLETRVDRVANFSLEYDRDSAG